MKIIAVDLDGVGRYYLYGVRNQELRFDDILQDQSQCHKCIYSLPCSRFLVPLSLHIFLLVSCVCHYSCYIIFIHFLFMLLVHSYLADVMYQIHPTHICVRLSVDYDWVIKEMIWFSLHRCFACLLCMWFLSFAMLFSSFHVFFLSHAFWFGCYHIYFFLFTGKWLFRLYYAKIGAWISRSKVFLKKLIRINLIIALQFLHWVCFFTMSLYHKILFYFAGIGILKMVLVVDL